MVTFFYLNTFFNLNTLFIQRLDTCTITRKVHSILLLKLPKHDQVFAFFLCLFYIIREFCLSVCLMQICVEPHLFSIVAKLLLFC